MLSGPAWRFKFQPCALIFSSRMRAMIPCMQRRHVRWPLQDRPLRALVGHNPMWAQLRRLRGTFPIALMMEG
eukprot:2538579-Pyramimonas_sp.AAC.1